MFEIWHALYNRINGLLSLHTIYTPILCISLNTYTITQTFTAIILRSIVRIELEADQLNNSESLSESNNSHLLFLLLALILCSSGAQAEHTDKLNWTFLFSYKVKHISYNHNISYISIIRYIFDFI